MNLPVLVVGAGPTGLMLANQLGRRGVSTLIIDRHSGPAQQTRAMAVQARTLEIYASLGIADQALALGKQGKGANLWAGGKRKARIPLGDIGQGLTAFPYVLMLGQDDNEHILGDQLRNWGLAVQWNTQLIGLAQHPRHVTATLKYEDGTTRTIQAMYVAGCDGGRSTVRELSGIKFPGAPYQHEFFVADTEATGSMVAGELNVYLWRDGFHLFFPMRGENRWRVIGILPGQLSGRNQLTFEDVKPAIMHEAGSSLIFRSCNWFSTYRIHHRCAERFRDRRCFLLGDAAHVHSPMGGQGMNTGLQDAYNLAWKLALVVADQADERLLNSYETERIKVAQRLLETTDRAFRIVVTNNWLAGLFRTRILSNIAAFAMTRERVRKLAFQTISQLGINYRYSQLSSTLPGLPKTAPQAGDRFPWLQLQFEENGRVEDLFQRFDDIHFNLILIGQPAAFSGTRNSGGSMRIHVIPGHEHNARELARANVPAQSFYLLRPDGYIGLAGTRLSAVHISRYFSDMGIHLNEMPVVNTSEQDNRPEYIV